MLTKLVMLNLPVNIQSFKLSQFFLHKSLSRTNNVICSILAISLLECTLCGIQLSTFMHLCGGNLVFACLNGLPMPWQIVLTNYLQLFTFFQLMLKI